MLDRTSSLALVRYLFELLGSQELGRAHPLSAAKEAFKHVERGLDPESAFALAEAVRYAITLKDLESEWLPQRENVAWRLRDAVHCNGLLLELDFFDFVQDNGVGEKARWHWRGYELTDGAPDWEYSDQLIVECKAVVPTSSNVEDVKDHLRKVARKYPKVSTQLLVVMGSRSSIQPLQNVLARRSDWFVDHPEVSGALLMEIRSVPPWICATARNSHALFPLSTKMWPLHDSEVVEYRTPGDKSSKIKKENHSHDATG